MGRGLGLRCSNCNYSKSFWLGIDMLFSPQNVFYESPVHQREPMLNSLVRSPKIKAKAFELLKKGRLPSDDYGNDIYYCPHCNEMYQRFYFRISTPKIDFEPDYKCSKCSHTLIRVNETESEGRIVLTDKTGKTIEGICPHCGNGKLTLDMTSSYM